MSIFFFSNALPTLLTMLPVLSVDSVSKSNVIFAVSGTMIWSLEPFGISISMFSFGYAIFVMLTLAICFLLPLKSNCILCSGMGSNSPHTLIYLYIILPWFCLRIYFAKNWSGNLNCGIKSLSKQSSNTRSLRIPHASQEPKIPASRVEVYPHALCGDPILVLPRVCIV